MNQRLHKNSSLSRLFFYIVILLMITISSTVFSKEVRKHIVVIIDNSGSMSGASGNDPATYSIQAAKIINDILKGKDEFSLIKLAPTSGCGSFNKNLNTSGGIGKSKYFKQFVDKGSSGTNFSVPVSNAYALFSKTKLEKKLLLVISDMPPKTVVNSCNAEKNLRKMAKSGIERAYIYIDKDNTNTSISHSLFNKGVKNVNTSKALIKAVASIYQSFIANNIPPQSGDIANKSVEININNYVRNAYLVVLSEGKVGKIIESKNNPKGSASININYKKGETIGSGDGKRREYKIVHLERPTAGKWGFLLHDLPSGAGWMVIQEYSVGIKFINKIVAEGVPVTIRAELIDEVTGKNLPIDKDMILSMKDQNGNTITFSRQGDTFVATTTPSISSNASNGTVEVTYRTTLTSTKKNIRKKQNITVKVEKGAWLIRPNIPTLVTIGKIVNLNIDLGSNGNSNILRKPTSFVVKLSTGEQLTLKSTGKLKYSVAWKPRKIGKVTMVFSASGGNKTIGANAEVKVIGDANFGKPILIDFGKLHSNMMVNKVLDLSNTKVFGTLPIKIKASYNKKNSVFEIKQNGKWLPINNQGELILQEKRQNKWSVRLVVKSCPEGVLSSEKFEVKAWFNKLDGTTVETIIPVKIEIEKDPWLVCWWKYILAAIITMLLIWIIYCIRSPARFPSSFELLLAPESDLREEGIIYKILNYKGTKSRFCGDARIFMHLDIRFTKSPKGAFVQFQARNDGVYIIALGNGSLWAQKYGLDWEEVPVKEEILLSSGTIYRNDSESLYFQARNI